LGVKENGNFINFSKDFSSIATLAAKQLTAEFELLAKSSKDISELDDITLIALEIQ
jgi:uncharacterized protein YkuJ